MKILTERLILRPVKMEDKESMFSYRSDAETYQYLTLIPKTINDMAEFIAKATPNINVPGTWFQLVLIEQSSQLLIGDIGLHFLDSDAENRQVEIGYTLNKLYRGNGFATEALTAVINHLFTTLNKHRIIASIDPTNIDSIKLMERLGFRKDAHFIKSLFFHGQWVDDVVFAILKKEWEEKKIENLNSK